MLRLNQHFLIFLPRCFFAVLSIAAVAGPGGQWPERRPAVAKGYLSRHWAHDPPPALLLLPSVRKNAHRARKSEKPAA
jgi:hypothetical protein